LKEDAQEYLEEKKLADLIKKHSEFINFPIKLRTFREEEKEVIDEDAQAEAEIRRAEAEAKKNEG